MKGKKIKPNTILNTNVMIQSLLLLILNTKLNIELMIKHAKNPNKKNAMNSISTPLLK